MGRWEKVFRTPTHTHSREHRVLGTFESKTQSREQVFPNPLSYRRKNPGSERLSKESAVAQRGKAQEEQRNPRPTPHSALPSTAGPRATSTMPRPLLSSSEGGSLEPGSRADYRLFPVNQLKGGRKPGSALSSHCITPSLMVGRSPRRIWAAESGSLKRSVLELHRVPPEKGKLPVLAQEPAWRET